MPSEAEVESLACAYALRVMPPDPKDLADEGGRWRNFDAGFGALGAFVLRGWFDARDLATRWIGGADAMRFSRVACVDGPTQRSLPMGDRRGERNAFGAMVGLVLCVLRAAR
jgi:hypothetical protein